MLDKALNVGDRSSGGRPPFDAVLKFKMLYLQAQHGLSFEQTEHLVRDRLSWMRFCGLSIADQRHRRIVFGPVSCRTGCP
ncbi:MAG: transposase [Alphaproteobacteria bacterium GM202ARS2]|nr:transposase [Alphaproteobacteria bacterium GM202ARS2]